jgi:Condensation domain
MGEKLVAPASFQQIDLLRQISEVPESAERFDGVMVFQLTGRLNVSALQGAIEDLVERHSTLRTTMSLDGSILSQVVHPGLVHPVMISQPNTTSVAEIAHEIRATRLSTCEVASGAPLFRAEIIVLDSMYLLALKVHHLISDGWSDAVMLRDLSELYRTRVEERFPDLPRLTLTYGDFARCQHAEWTLLRSRVVEYWTPQLAGYPGAIIWPRPTVLSDHPLECRVVTRDLDAQATLGVRSVAWAWHLPPFLVLVAATVLAIGDRTGRYDFLLGSNVANREALEKHDLIGYFTNTRLMRIRLAPQMDLGAAAAIVREQWLAGDDLRDAYIDQVLLALGLPRVIKIDALDLPLSVTREGRLDFPDIVASTPPLSPGRYRHWRDLNVTWIPSQGGFRIDLRHRLAALDEETATAIAEGAVTILTRLARKDSPI